MATPLPYSQRFVPFRASASFILVVTSLCSLVNSVTLPYGMPLDGSKHNTRDIEMNRLNTRFLAQKVYYADGISSIDGTLPNARNISNIVFSTPPFRLNNYHVAAMTAAWGQFIAHDLIMTTPHTSDALSADYVPIMVPICDVNMDASCTGTQALKFFRNLYDTTTGTSAVNPRRQLNMQTGWLDGSVIYGTSSDRLIALRSFVKGELLADEVNGVPRNFRCLPMAGHFRNDCDQRLTGDVRGNVAPGILSLHGLFVLEHNRWARELATANPAWGDERLFQEARKRVIAVIQAITHYEYMPVLLGEALPPYGGYNDSVDARLDPSFAIAAYRYGHSGIDSVYACINNAGEMCATGNLVLRDVYFQPAYLDWGVTIADLLRGLVSTFEGHIDTAIVPDVRNHLEGIRQDLVALDIMRGRDFGLPTYNQVRRDLGLAPISAWNELTSDVRIQAAMQRAYGPTVEKLDLWVGGLAEASEGNRFIGPTFRAIIKDQFLRLRDGDVYWFENPAIYENVAGREVRYLDATTVASIQATKLADVIKRNTDWDKVPSAFTVSAANMLISPDGSTGNPPLHSDGNTQVAKATINSLLSLEWKPPAEDSITITFRFRGQGWLGVGIGATTMIGADVWLLRYINGRGEAIDGRAPSYAMPLSDTSQDVRVDSATMEAGVLTITVTRKLRTSDDTPITSGIMALLFAWDTSSTSFGYHGGNRAAVGINFFQDARSGNGSYTPISLDNDAAIQAQLMSAYGAHGLTMFFVWGLLVPIGIIAMRFLKHFPAHQTFHKFSMITAGSITLPAAAAALAQTSNSINVAHRWVGISLAVLLAIQIILGVQIRVWLRSDKLPPPYWMRVRQFHKIIGWAMALLGLSNCFVGSRILLPEIGHYLMTAVVVLLIVAFIALTAMDEYARNYRANTDVLLDKDTAKRVSMSHASTSLTMAQVKANVTAGCKWVIMQGWVYDIGPFVKNHPGGAHLLERCIGTDVSQFFLGREAFDTGVKPYAHSERAYRLLRTLCVGALKAEAAISSWAEVPTLPDDECTDAWILRKRTVMPGDVQRPVVKLEFYHRSAQGTAALDWKPASFGRYMIVKVPSDVFTGAKRSSDQGSAMKRAVSFWSRQSRAKVRQSPNAHVHAGTYTPGNVTGQTPNHVKQAMGTWYARSTRLSSDGDTARAASQPPRPPASSVRGIYKRDRSAPPVQDVQLREWGSPRRQTWNAHSDPESFGGPGNDPPADLMMDPTALMRTAEDMIDTEGWTKSTYIERPYTLVRASGKDGVILYIRRYPRGLVSRYMFDLKVGDKVLMSGPKGTGLHLDDSQSGVVVAIMQGTCVSAIFDLLQQIHETALARMDVQSNPVGEGYRRSSLQRVTSPAKISAGFPHVSKINIPGSASPTDTNSNGDAERPAHQCGSSLEAQHDALESPNADTSSSERSPMATLHNHKVHKLAIPRDLSVVVHSTDENSEVQDSTATDSGERRSKRPHLKLVLLVVAEHEEAIVEGPWLRQMDQVCPDFELHVNLKHELCPGGGNFYPRIALGRLTHARLASLLPPSDLLTVSLCGTPDFIRSLRQKYLEMGLPKPLLSVVS